MSKRYYIDSAMLRRRGACKPAVRRFEAVFGTGHVELTLDNVRRAMSADLDVTWPARMPWALANCEIGYLFDALYDAALDADETGDAKAILRVLRRAPAAWRLFDEMEGAPA